MTRVLAFGDNVVDKYEHRKMMYPGGNCLNVAVFAKQFGVDSAAYMGIFGTDPEAEHVVLTLGQLGIEAFKCKQVPGANGCAYVTLIGNERVFLGSNEGGIRHHIPFVLDRFDLEYIRTFDVVHSGNYSFTEKELHKIRSLGVPLSFDFSDDSSPDYLARVAPEIDYAFISLGDMEISAIKESMERIATYGCRLVIATRGSQGLAAYNGDRFFFQAATPVTAVDTMGAGDASIAAFLVSYLNGKKLRSESELIQECLQKAASFAAGVCQIEGSFGYGRPYN